MACVGRTKQCTIVPSNHYGPIPGVPVGSLWKFRVQVSGTELYLSTNTRTVSQSCLFQSPPGSWWLCLVMWMPGEGRKWLLVSMCEDDLVFSVAQSLELYQRPPLIHYHVHSGQWVWRPQATCRWHSWQEQRWCLLTRISWGLWRWCGMFFCFFPSF